MAVEKYKGFLSTSAQYFAMSMEKLELSQTRKFNLGLQLHLPDALRGLAGQEWVFHDNDFCYGLIQKSTQSNAEVLCIWITPGCRYVHVKAIRGLPAHDYWPEAANWNLLSREDLDPLIVTGSKTPEDMVNQTILAVSKIMEKASNDISVKKEFCHEANRGSLPGQNRKPKNTQCYS